VKSELHRINSVYQDNEAMNFRIVYILGESRFPSTVESIEIGALLTQSGAEIRTFFCR